MPPPAPTLLGMPASAIPQAPQPAPVQQPAPTPGVGASVSPAPAPAPQPSTGKQDPGVISLAMAIRQTESNSNFTAKGASGEFGAYQWMPGTWQSDAKAAGVDPSDTSASAQDKVAYTSILNMKQAGLSPAQIASKWNSGNPNAYLSNAVGTNSKGVHYDVPGYVSKVMGNFTKQQAQYQAWAASHGGSPAAPDQGDQPETPDQQSAGQTAALFPSNTVNGNPAGEVAKTVANVIPSAAHDLYGAALGAVTKIPQAVAQGAEALVNPTESLKSDVDAQKASEQGEADEANKLVQQYQDMKASGQDTTHIEAYMKQQGIDPSKIQTAPNTPGAGQQAATIVDDTVAPDAVRALGRVVQGAFNGNPQTEGGTSNQVDTNLQRLQRDVTNDPFGSIAPVVGAFQGAASAAGSFGDAALGDEGAATEGASPEPPEAPEAPQPGAASPGIAARLYARLTGVKPTTLSTAAANPNVDLSTVTREGVGSDVESALNSKTSELGVTPQSLGQEIQSALDQRAEALSETGKGYGDTLTKGVEIPGSGGQTISPRVAVDPGYLDDVIKKTTGLQISGAGKLTPTTTSTLTDSGAIGKLQSIYDLYKPAFEAKPGNATGTITAQEFMSLRTQLANLAKYDSTTAASGLSDTARAMRADLNSTYRSQIPGLPELDADYSAQSKEIADLKKGIVDRDGNITDSGMSKIAKAKAASPNLFAKLEKISPGITEKIQAMQDLKDLGKGLVDENGKMTDSGLAKIAKASELKPGLLEKLEKISPGITDKIKVLQAAEDIRQVAEKSHGGFVKTALGVGGIVLGASHFSPIEIGASLAELVATNPDLAVKVAQAYGRMAAKIPAYGEALQAAASKLNSQNLYAAGSLASPVAKPQTMFGS